MSGETSARRSRTTVMMLRPILTAAVLACTLAPAAAPAQPPSAEEFYARAVARMREYPQPPFATYQATLKGLNCHLDGQNSMNCSVSLTKASTAIESYGVS